MASPCFIKSLQAHLSFRIAEFGYEGPTLPE